MKKVVKPLQCVAYVAVLGVFSFVLGRLLPKHWFHSDAFPFRCGEKEARFYRLLRVKDWQSKVPDMSKIFVRIMPPKRINAETLTDLPRMLAETCVAELIHVMLSLAGLACLWIWPGPGGALFTAAYLLLGNVPFILIQRYNRPRLQKLLDRRRARGKGENCGCAF